MEAEFRHDMLAVGFYGGNADRVLQGDLLRGEPFGDQLQNLPHSDSLEAMLKAILRKQREIGLESDYVIVDEKGKPLSAKKVQHTMKAARDQAGLGVPLATSCR